MTLSANDLLAVLGAIALAGIGGELFLKGVLGTAAWLRVPKLLVATSLAAFATSSPELTVSTVAALSGQPEIGLGDALGSNVVNIALLFGLALFFGPIRVAPRDLGRDFVLALAIPLLTFLFALDGTITRQEGVILLLVFATWLWLLMRAGVASRGSGEFVDVTDDELRPWLAVVSGLAGLTLLIFAGRLFVSSATGIATAFGVDAYIVGATVVAIGTSLPELVTVLLARYRGHDDIGVGTLLGSNLYNGMAIVGVAASIHPIQAAPAEVAIALGIGTLSLLLLIPGRDGIISRARGYLLLASYAVFVVATITTGRAL
ncbi:MAG: sodium:calcium antiporter [Gammaproteobacteria bacterium]|nr:sodium:calcium antiporter [Rhodocyclaceae bacterium]MBU3909085.1 sodium:calcium antiporter [Gammaproteobacteria bacterium]MBU3990808.1 sodium:calcium antiporter [Gammaproteobacteria bacterium]MBU4003296.1 sodium:calcium antiporter [Gammaproteobacteria bacterium]MBU4022128.1 sodium:calcium antiporter [Gammaproteobacteria bacterium]